MWGPAKQTTLGRLKVALRRYRVSDFSFFGQVASALRSDRPERNGPREETALVPYRVCTGTVNSWGGRDRREGTVAMAGRTLHCART